MSTTPVHASTKPFSALAGVAALAVLLQGLWAGMFMSTPDTDPQDTPWLEVHSWCGKFAILFALLATIYAFVKLKHRNDLKFGGLAFTVILILEAYLGGLIVDDGKDVMAAVHVPLAMALMALSVWLPLRARKNVDADPITDASVRTGREHI